MNLFAQLEIFIYVMAKKSPDFRYLRKKNLLTMKPVFTCSNKQTKLLSRATQPLYVPQLLDL